MIGQVFSNFCIWGKKGCFTANVFHKSMELDYGCSSGGFEKVYYLLRYVGS